VNIRKLSKRSRWLPLSKPLERAHRQDRRRVFAAGGRIEHMQWKLFANLAEAAGDRRIDVDLPGGATIGDALTALLDRYPALEAEVLNDDGDLRDHIQLLRNGRNPFVTANGLETDLDEGDELALFPPVSGGRDLDSSFRSGRSNRRSPIGFVSNRSDARYRPNPSATDRVDRFDQFGR
jgi:molybdopterin synthase sulfur carrier subunit